MEMSTMNNQGPQCELHTRDIQRLVEDVKSVKHVLFGNGRPGFGDRLIVVEEAMKLIKWVAATSGAAVLVGLVNLILNLLKP